ncbi:MAG: endonuclease/exonuclease/phosphatase family protein [Bacteroidota bacterium]
MHVPSKFSLLLLALICSIPALGQERKSYGIRTVAFYNVENLFDTQNDSATYDDNRTPTGKDRWTDGRYRQKIAYISRVISEIGVQTTKTSPDVIGLCEVENRRVLEDLVQHPNLVQRDYGIIHYDSPDERGIDVALLYRKSSFIPHSFDSRRLLLFNAEGHRDYTRDQLVVSGLLDEEQLYFIVNHWPSRSGGEARSRPYRLAAAQLNRRIMDSLIQQDPEAKIISMGDLNDDPQDTSLKKVLKTSGSKVVNDTLLENISLFNPMEKLFRKGLGSLAYRDQWNLFDQIFFTTNLLHPNKETFRFWKAGIFDVPYLRTQKGRYKGYPLRTYAGGQYVGGYSDHFPVYIYLIREVVPKL